MVELAVDHEGAVAGEDVRDGGGGEFTGFVCVAEEEFAGGEGLPGAVGHQLALAGLGLAADAEVVGVAEAVGVAEVLLEANLAVDGEGGCVLSVEELDTADLFDDLSNLVGAGVERFGGYGIDSEPYVDVAVAPDGIPVLGVVATCVA